MRRAKVTSEIDIGSHPAVVEWMRTGMGGSLPTRVETLREINSEQDKCGVYRLWGAGPRGGAVIAKDASESTVALEALIYQEVLPRMSRDHLHCYAVGAAREPGRSWIFLENAVGREYDEDCASDRVLAAGWLADLHVVSNDPSLRVRLPDAGTSRVAENLTRAIHHITVSVEDGLNRGNSGLAYLRRILVDLQERWSEVEELCDQLPHALVHGDFKDENVLISQFGSSVRLRVIDWEFAGWGPICMDLFRISEEYRYAQRSSQWLGGAPDLVGHLATVFRMVACIDWAAQCLCGPRHSSIQEQLSMYAVALSRSCGALGWDA